MSSPLLRLQGSVWNQILSYLVSDGASRLMMTGNPHLYGLLQRSINRLDVRWKTCYIDLEKGLCAASQFPQLTSLSISGFDAGVIARLPSSALEFPPQLRSLSFSFRDCLAYMQACHPLAKLLSLQELKLEGYSKVSVLLSGLAAVFPPNLLSLELSCLHDSSESLGYYYGIYIGSGDIGSLPRSLETLVLRNVLSRSKQPKNGEFPPNLTSFTTTNGYWPLFAIPRTIRKLSFGSEVILKGGLNDRLSSKFPWRSYFPYLENLTWHHMPSHRFDLLLASSAAADPEFERVQKKMALYPIESDPSSRSDGATEANWKELNFTTASEEARKDPKELYPQLLHLLSSVEVLQSFSQSPSMLEYSHNLRSLSILDMDLPGDVALPATLTDIMLHRMEMTSIGANVRHLSLSYLSTPTKSGTAMDSDLPFPAQALLTFCLRNQPLELHLARILPPSISTLELSFKPEDLLDTPDLSPAFDLNRAQLVDAEKWMNTCDKTWRAIIPRLSTLKTLKISIRSGHPSMTLSPIVSPDFDELVLSSSTSTSPLDAWLSALLDGPEFSGSPQVLPPSLKKIAVQTHRDPFPLKMIPALPRSLTHFESLDLSQDRPVNIFPFFDGLTPSESLSRLPSGLRYLQCGRGHPGIHTQVDLSAILALPKNLVALRLPVGMHICDPLTSQQLDFADIARAMPPHMSWVEYSPAKRRNRGMVARYGAVIIPFLDVYRSLKTESLIDKDTVSAIPDKDDEDEEEEEEEEEEE